MNKYSQHFVHGMTKCTFLLMITSVLSLFVVSGCGRAEFAAQSLPASPVSVPILTIGTDSYVEIGQEMAPQATGDINLTLAQLFATTAWTGINNLTFEVRIATVGNTAPGAVSISGTKPGGWDAATTIFNQPVAGGNVATILQSANIASAVSSVLKGGKFWILVRLNYSVSGFGDAFPLTLSLKNVYLYAEGNKSLKALSPLLNLGF